MLVGHGSESIQALKVVLILQIFLGLGVQSRSVRAGFSFSLYCIHVPLLMLYAFGIGNRMKPSGMITWLIVLGALAACVVDAYGFSILTEAKTGQIRRWIFGRLRVRLRPLHFVE